VGNLKIEVMKNNNDWIKIEDGINLPAFTIEYWVMIKGRIRKAYYKGFNRWLIDSNDYPKTTEIHGITHYQEIKTPLTPLY
jgi:hypothetical protein